MISEISINQSLIKTNLLHFHGEVDQIEANKLVEKADSVVRKNNAQKTGGAITVTNSRSVKYGKIIMNIDFYFPIDRKLDKIDDFDFVEELRIDNAIKVCVNGNPNDLPEAFNRLTSYIKDNKITPVTGIYIVTANYDPTDEFIVEIYVGV